jgi:hypothetical protein
MVTVDELEVVSVIRYSPSKHSMNLATLFSPFAL